MAGRVKSQVKENPITGILTSAKHPFAVYYSDQDEIRYVSFVFISECLIHNTVALHLFQRKLISFLKSEVMTTMQKNLYFSDD